MGSSRNEKLMKWGKEFVVMTVGTAIVACAVYFFLVPSHTAISSISGLAVVLQNFLPLPVSGITMSINVILLILGFLTCGHEFGLKTVYTSLLLPVFLRVLEVWFPDLGSLTGDQLLDVISFIFTLSLGTSLLFSINASSGGTDIIAMILNRYLHMDLGAAVTITGTLIALSSALVYDIKTCILSVLGSYFCGIILDSMLFSQTLKRRVCIVSPMEEEIRRYIINDLGSGATIYEAIGAYHMQKHREIIVIVNKHEFQKLMNFLQKTDPQAFITVYKVSEMHFRSKKLAERKF